MKAEEFFTKNLDNTEFGDIAKANNIDGNIIHWMEAYANQKVLEALEEVDGKINKRKRIILENKDGTPHTKREIEFITLHLGSVSELVKTEVEPKYKI